MNNTMSSYFSNLYLLSAIIISMIIHLILLIVTDLTLNHRDYLSPPSDIEISLITPTPSSIQTPNNDNLQKEVASETKERTKDNKVIVPIVQKRIKNNAVSVKAPPTVKKIIAIDSNQILNNIKESIPISIPNNNKKLRSKKISSSTADYEYRLYYEAWRQKVERIGALNYPEAAKSSIFGALRLTVSLTQAGTIKNIIIDKSSGHSELDKAAISIVKMGAPYAKFSDRMRNEVDIIRITRTWKFTEGSKFSSH
jgi:TonB family protein